MSLLVLMYHRARADAHGNAPELLDAHFRLIARRCACLLPGEPLDPERLNVCLSFDDAYYDFYAVAFPLLEKYRLRALLAVSPGLILEDTAEAPADRLSLSTYEAYAQQDKAGLCTWKELRELVSSGMVRVAAHGRTHARLDNDRADLEREIVSPKRMLRERLGGQSESFVYPFGRFNGPAHARARAHYRHIFRIGQASNRGWDANLLYRVCADRMRAPDELFAGARLLRYRASGLWNRLRGV